MRQVFVFPSHCGSLTYAKQAWGKEMNHSRVNFHLVTLFFIFASGIAQAAPYPASVSSLQPTNEIYQCGSFVYAKALEQTNSGFKYREDIWLNSRGDRAGLQNYFYGDYPRSIGWVAYKTVTGGPFYFFKDTSVDDPNFEIRLYDAANIHKVVVDQPKAVYKCQKENIQENFDALVANETYTFPNGLSDASKILLSPTVAYLNRTDLLKNFLGSHPEYAQSLLIYANGNRAVGDALISAGADINRPYIQPDQWNNEISYLTFALIDGQFNYADYLISKGATLWSKKSEFSFAFMILMKANGFQIDLEKVLNFVISRFPQDKEKILNGRYTVFPKACDPRITCENYKAVRTYEYYWQKPLNNNIKGDWKQATTLAARFGDLAALKLLVANGATYNMSYLLTAAALSNQESTLQYILSGLTSPTQDDLKDAGRAIFRTWSMLPTPKPDENFPDDSFFEYVLNKYFIADRGPILSDAHNLTTLHYLLKAGYRVNDLAEYGKPTIVSFIWQVVAGSDKQSEKNHYDMAIELLMQHPELVLDYNPPNSSPGPIYFYVLRGFGRDEYTQAFAIELLKALHAHPNARPDIKDYNGRTPQQFACDSEKEFPYYKPACEILSTPR